MFQFPHTRIPIHVQSVPNVNEWTGPNDCSPKFRSVLYFILFVVRISTLKLNHPVHVPEFQFDFGLKMTPTADSNFGPKVYCPDRVLVRYFRVNPKTTRPNTVKMGQQCSNCKNVIFGLWKIKNLKKFFWKIFGVFMIKWTFRLIALGLE